MLTFLYNLLEIKYLGYAVDVDSKIKVQMITKKSKQQFSLAADEL